MIFGLGFLIGTLVGVVFSLLCVKAQCRKEQEARRIQ